MTQKTDHSGLDGGAMLSNLSELCERYDGVLCDIWGVLHNGERSQAAAADALRHLRRLGKPVTLITNAPRPKAEVAEQLASLGITAESYDAIATSGDVCAQAIVDRLPGLPYLIGPDRDLPVFAAASSLAGRKIAPVPLEAADFAVCTGLVDDTVETPDDYVGVLKALRAKNLPMICANPDLVVYRGDQLVFCAGAVAERYEAMGGEVEQAGKPYAAIYRLALGLLERARNRPLDLDRVLAIGDAMHTDIAGATAMGLDSLLITEGIHRKELHEGEGGPLDAEGYKQFTHDHGISPVYRMNRLAW
ncbi:TIGR01459 family HAD-type hydrolase [uncultured Rhodoblastus sp.]|uniref:TIGR01459 family HAD-type hydrolase n=1 Tax=uncultured Rhodoblastus sp. TaxID=543037 RepID=UPI0025D44DFA|nr:TIGR01459 family HAD-type hydrolase [uncultured Rhodoblastus sp.]